MIPAWKGIGRFALMATLGLAILAAPAIAKEINLNGDQPKEEKAEAVGAAQAPEQTPAQTLEQITAEEQLKQNANKVRAELYFKSGKSLFEELKYDEAKAEFEKALELNPGLQSAKEYLRRTETILGLREARYEGILDQVRNEKIVERKLAHHEMKIAFENAKNLMKNGNYEEAITRFERVRELVKWIAPYFNQDDLEPYKSQTEEYIKQASNERKLQEQREREQEREKAEEVAKMNAQYLKQRHEQRIETLLGRGKDLLNEARYLEAKQLAESILEIEPLNKEALALRDLALETYCVRTTDSTKKASAEETRLTWIDSKKAQVPYSDILVYPDNWAEIVKRQVQSIGASEEEKPPWVDELQTKLDQKVTFDFIETPLRDVVTFLQQITNATIILDDDALQNVANPDVTLKVTDMKLSQALDWILVGAGLKYALRDEAIYISTEEKVGGDAQLKLYDVTDVILEIKDFPGDLRKLRDRIGTSSGGGDAATDIGEGFGFPDEGATSQNKNIFTGETLVNFIKATIAPNTWDDTDFAN